MQPGRNERKREKIQYEKQKIGELLQVDEDWDARSGCFEAICEPCFLGPGQAVERLASWRTEDAHGIISHWPARVFWSQIAWKGGNCVGLAAIPQQAMHTTVRVAQHQPACSCNAGTLATQLHFRPPPSLIGSSRPLLVLLVSDAAITMFRVICTSHKSCRGRCRGIAVRSTKKKKRIYQPLRTAGLPAAQLVGLNQDLGVTSTVIFAYAII